MAAKKKLKEEEKRKLNKKNLKKVLKLFSYTLPYKGKFMVGLIFLAVGSVAMMGFPLLAGKMIDVAQGKAFYIFDTVSSIAFALITVILFQGFIAFFRVYLFSVVSEKSMADLRFDLYNHMVLLPMKFYDENRTGELMSRISSDVSTLQSTFTTTLAELIRQIITLVVGIAIIVLLAPKLTVFMLAIFPLMIAGALVFGRLIRKQTKKTQDELAKTNVIVEETLQAINTVKSFTGEIFELKRYRTTLSNTVAIAIKASLYRSGFIAYMIPASFGVFAAVMWYGASQLQSGELDPGSLISFVLIMGFVGGSIAGLGSLFTQIQSAIGSSERILEIMDEETEKGLQKNDDIMPLEGNIDFDSVTFSYPSRKDFTVLKNLDIRIKQGEKIALAGKSGAGKSTIAQLLQNFYQIEEGKVLIDGIEASKVGLKRLRGNIGIVPQEVILFGGSIRENILYGKAGATDEEIKQAAMKANAWQFIETFPEGMDTLVGERGVKLSGGQKQRVAIARAILKDPAILILDEATSSLDAESEHLVQQALENLMQGRTTLIIAHRLATIRSADKILILDDGHIAESGTHDELVSIPDGKYSNLVKLQMDGFNS